MKSFKQWVYHHDHSPKIIDSEDFEKMQKHGWCDSPAKCKESKKKKGK